MKVVLESPWKVPVDDLLLLETFMDWKSYWTFRRVTVNNVTLCHDVFYGRTNCAVAVEV